MVHLYSWSKRVRDWVQTLLKLHPTHVGWVAISTLLGSFQLNFKKPKTKAIAATNQKKRFTSPFAKCLKRFKTQMTKSRLFLFLHPIGREDDVRFLDQSQSKVL